jgi:hypothetical protein
MFSPPRPPWWRVSVIAVLVWFVAPLNAQFQMPDPKQMSGIPRPVTDLPDRAISVRLIRGDLSNNITGFPVELHVGSKVQTVRTDEAGRAQFNDVPAGATVKAVAVVDGERLESQEFPAPERGGIRLMLVATDKTKSDRAVATPVSGQVAISGQSRIIIEPGDEAVQVFYLLEIVNAARAPVNPPAPFVFDMPTGAVGTSLLEGSSPKASVSGTRVRVEGPFPAGQTRVQVASELPALGGSIDIAQTFPADLEQVAVLVKKLGPTRLVSPQILNQQDMTAQGEVFIAATGGRVPAGQAIVLRLEDLPHHSALPRWIALVLAAMIVAAGVWASTRREEGAIRAAERKRLVARRDKLFDELVRLETDHRNGRGDHGRYVSRREELVTALEHIYGALDVDDAAVQTSDRSRRTPSVGTLRTT